MTEICAPVSIRAVTVTSSTKRSKILRRVGIVNRGFAEWVVNAASPPGAAWSSFPRLRAQVVQGTWIEKSSAREIGGLGVMVTG